MVMKTDFDDDVNFGNTKIVPIVIVATYTRVSYEANE